MRKKRQQRAPYVIYPCADKICLGDTNPPEHLSLCGLEGIGTFKRAYSCNYINQPLTFKNIQGDTVTVTDQFVVYQPTEYILQIARTNPYEAQMKFQSSIANIMEVASYNPYLKDFFINPLQTIVLTEENVEYYTLLVPRMRNIPDSPSNSAAHVNRVELFMGRLID